MIPPFVAGLLRHLRLPALALLALLAAYETGIRAERARGEAAALRVRLETAQRDLSIARTAAETARAAGAALGARAKTLQERLDNAPPADAGCGPYTAADLERLRQLLQ